MMGHLAPSPGPFILYVCDPSGCCEVSRHDDYIVAWACFLDACHATRGWRHWSGTITLRGPGVEEVFDAAAFAAEKAAEEAEGEEEERAQAWREERDRARAEQAQEQAQAPDDDDADWRREQAMEAGMLGGIGAYNDVMGY